MALSKKQKKGLLRGAVVTAVTLAIIIGAGFVLTLRKSESFFNVKGLYAADDPKVLFVGNSHAIADIQAREFDKLTGTRSYNMATTSQTVLSADLLVKEAVATHENIDVIFVETFSMIYPTPADQGYSRSLDSDTSVFRSVENIFTKLSGMIQQRGARRKFDAFLPLFKYHANWKNPALWHTRFLCPKTLQKNYDQYLRVHAQGSRYTKYVMPAEKYASYQNFTYVFSVADAMDANLKYWDSIIKTCQAHNIEVVFVTVPWLPRFVEHTNYDEIYAAFTQYFEKKGVVYIDFNRMDFPLAYTDFANDIIGPNQHMNVSGAEKVTEWLAAWYAAEFGRGE